MTSSASVKYCITFVFWNTNITSRRSRFLPSNRSTESSPREVWWSETATYFPTSLSARRELRLLDAIPYIEKQGKRGADVWYLVRLTIASSEQALGGVSVCAVCAVCAVCYLQLLFVLILSRGLQFGRGPHSRVVFGPLFLASPNGLCTLVIRRHDSVTRVNVRTRTGCVQAMTQITNWGRTLLDTAHRVGGR